MDVNGFSLYSKHSKIIFNRYVFYRKTVHLKSTDLTIISFYRVPKSEVEMSARYLLLEITEKEEKEGLPVWQS